MRVRITENRSFQTPYSETESLEWLMRYGNIEEILKVRFIVAAALDSYRALINTTNRDRNMVVNEIKRHLVDVMKMTAEEAIHRRRKNEK